MISTTIGEWMRRIECERGGKCVQPGEAQWFSRDDWHDDAVVALYGREVHIVAIIAKTPRNGAFKRLIEGIRSAGLEPVVVGPFPVMKSILKRWGWKEVIVGDTFETRRREWRAETR